jgi:16S rRNA (adenine1518-N6/adenine1519-N6)-dimethyltransferase
LVIEIGAGTGALTRHLLARAARVVAIETDPVLISRLSEKFAGSANLELVHGDVLETDLSRWGPAAVAGNLPYYITSPILKKVLDLGPLLRRAVFLVQHEVARRLVAGPGSRDYGFLTVLVRLSSDPECLFTVPPAAFRPPPKVDSAVVRLSPRPVADRWGIEDPSAFLEFAGHCFRQKRKTIRNNLTALFGKVVLDGLPEASLRAEQLSLAELAALYHRLGTEG